MCIYCTEAQAYGKSFFGMSANSIVLGSFECEGNETSLLSCSHANASSSCSAETLAGVTCQNNSISICERNGYFECCTEDCMAIDELAKPCYCDKVCHELDDCCPGIELTCPLNSS